MPVVLLIAAGALVLQYRLCKLPRRWPGLLLPLVCFLLSLGVCAWLVFFSQPREVYTLRTTDGLYHHFETQQEAERFVSGLREPVEITHVQPTAPNGTQLVGLAGVFVGVNLFTLLLFLFYARRRRQKRRFMP